jgi:hypothetical protein
MPGRKEDDVMETFKPRKVVLCRIILSKDGKKDKCGKLKMR